VDEISVVMNFENFVVAGKETIVQHVNLVIGSDFVNFVVAGSVATVQH